MAVPESEVVMVLSLATPKNVSVYRRTDGNVFGIATQEMVPMGSLTEISPGTWSVQSHRAEFTSHGHRSMAAAARWLADRV